jgi:hypothetical protein
MIVQLVKEERPLQFFSLCGLLLLLLGNGLGVPVILEFLHTGFVPRLPTAVLATGCVLLSFLSFAAGLILESVTRGRKEVKRLAYLAIPSYDQESGDAPRLNAGARLFGAGSGCRALSPGDR